MKYTFLMLTALLFSTLNLSAQSGPQLTFEFETFDFGDLKEGDKAEVDFIFKNTGSESLVLSEVRASCGCTTPFWSKEPVMPGEEGRISVKYDTKGRIYPFNKAVTVTSNAGPETKRIFIKGNVTGANNPKEDISNKSGVPEKTPSIVNNLGD